MLRGKVNTSIAMRVARISCFFNLSPFSDAKEWFSLDLSVLEDLSISCEREFLSMSNGNEAIVGEQSQRVNR
jgi:hypothetical protein